MRFRGRVNPIPPDIPVDPAIRMLSDGPHSSAVQFAHPLVDGRVFFSLPQRLLALLEKQFTKTQFDPQLWDLERWLSNGVVLRSDFVGYFDGLPLNYPYLHDPLATTLQPECFYLPGWTDEHKRQVSAITQTLGTRSARFHVPARGYCGWLLTNQQFLTEHDELLKRWRGHLFHYGLPGSSVFIQRHPRQDSGACETIASSELLNDFSIFYLRWRLRFLEAPYLPIPAVPQVPTPLPARNSSEIGTTLFLPDTFPVPSRDELREMMEDALRGGARQEHLSEWHALVRSDNKSKTGIARFGRIFVLQHYWSVLHHRHQQSLKRKEGELKLVMARYLFDDAFSEKDATIHQDLLSIRDRLGAGWHLTDEPEVG